MTFDHQVSGTLTLDADVIVDNAAHSTPTAMSDSMRERMTTYIETMQTTIVAALEAADLSAPPFKRRDWDLSNQPGSKNDAGRRRTR